VYTTGPSCTISICDDSTLHCAAQHTRKSHIIQSSPRTHRSTGSPPGVLLKIERNNSLVRSCLSATCHCFTHTIAPHYCLSARRKFRRYVLQTAIRFTIRWDGRSVVPVLCWEMKLTASRAKQSQSSIEVSCVHTPASFQQQRHAMRYSHVVIVRNS
jgi:hypothetical protein